MKNPKLVLGAWSIILTLGAAATYYYIKISTTPVFSVISTKKVESGAIEGSSQKGWFAKISEKESTDLYPATEIAFSIDMNEPKEDGKEFYYILSVSKLSEEKFRIVEKKLSSLKVLYSVKKNDDGFSVVVSLKDKVSMQKLASELKNSL